MDLFGQEVDLLEEGYLTFAWREAKDVDLTLLREELATEILQECSLALAVFCRGALRRYPEVGSGRGH